MIIECINCSKKFDVNSDLIPASGRTIQCGSCNHIWFYKKEHQDQYNPTEIDTELKSIDIEENKKKEPLSKPVYILSFNHQKCYNARNLFQIKNQQDHVFCS